MSTTSPHHQPPPRKPKGPRSGKEQGLPRSACVRRDLQPTGPPRHCGTGRAPHYVMRAAACLLTA
eukprot:13191764-Alexandrium_andersonii.AAC.1